MIRVCAVLDDKSMCSVGSLRVRFKIDLDFSEMRKIYSIKPKKNINTYTKKKYKKELERVHERNFENSRNFLRKGTFTSDSVVQVFMPVHSLKKGNKELMAKVNLE